MSTFRTDLGKGVNAHIIRTLATMVTNATRLERALHFDADKPGGKEVLEKVSVAKDHLVSAHEEAKAQRDARMDSRKPHRCRFD